MILIDIKISPWYWLKFKIIQSLFMAYISLNQKANESLHESTININPLLHKFFFSSVFEAMPRIGCYRLPTHRRGAHGKFLLSFFIKKSKFGSCVHYSDRYVTKSWTNLNFFILFNPLLHEFFFCRFSRHSLGQAAIVHRLIDAALIGIFLIDPS